VSVVFQVVPTPRLEKKHQTCALTRMRRKKVWTNMKMTSVPLMSVSNHFEVYSYYFHDYYIVIIIFLYNDFYLLVEWC
jgi:hypothetical protein